MKRYFCLLSVFFFSVISVIAQNDNSNPDTVLSVDNQMILLSQINIENPNRDTSMNSSTSNSIFIQQVGQRNDINANVNANRSNIVLVQNGNNNVIEIDETSFEIQKTISQNGQNNVVLDYSFDPKSSTSLELMQEGDNLYFERFGTNELSNSLKFKMTGNARSIIIRSF